MAAALIPGCTRTIVLGPGPEVRAWVHPEASGKEIAASPDAVSTSERE
jgi:hypothetical protein